MSTQQQIILTQNIGPGRNSIAALVVGGGTLTPEEEAVLRDYLRWEDGATLEVIAGWLAATRGLEVRLGGAHHQIEVFDDDEDTGPVEGCLFCGGDFRWAVRCTGNRAGDV